MCLHWSAKQECLTTWGHAGGAAQMSLGGGCWAAAARKCSPLAAHLLCQHSWAAEHGGTLAHLHLPCRQTQGLSIAGVTQCILDWFARLHVQMLCQAAPDFLMCVTSATHVLPRY